MKRIFTSISVFAICSMLQAQDIPSFTYDQSYSYPSGAVDGSAGTTFDPANMCCLYQGSYLIPAFNVGSFTVTQSGGSALIEIHVPPFVSGYTFSVDDPILAAGNPTIRMTLLGEYAVGSAGPTDYTLGDINESNWAFIHSANRNFYNSRDQNFSSQASVARIAMYNGLNWGYTTLSDYAGDISISDIDITWYIAQEDSLDFVNWANGSTASVNEFDKEKVNVFPNPTKNLVTISGTNKVNNYKISDLSGKVVQSNDSFNGTQIDFSNLENGLYLLMLQTDKGITTKRIIKE